MIKAKIEVGHVVFLAMKDKGSMKAGTLIVGARYDLGGWGNLALL